MYDWPEVHGAVDALWAAIYWGLRDAGIDAPEGVWRPDRPEDLWTHPDLLIGEMCGYQIVNELRGRVEVLGVLDRGVDGCEPGDYRSVLVCRDDDSAVGLEDFRDRTVAVNGHRSQSGYGALVHEVAPLAVDGRFFDSEVTTGSHRGSMRAVADGRADVAAIDEVSWRLGLDHEPVVDRLRIVAWTEPTPGVPLVTSWTNAGLRDRLNDAISTAVADLDVKVREPLHLYGYRPRPTSDYEVIVERLAAGNL
ncbi:MAG: PhnD/SsuA/transferrin family substrate-binding protein [Actinobacteria bacterium]|nr:PhnD/SsuA/transferrin family substrate-binding protein [Actinomycetota bacterium]